MANLKFAVLGFFAFAIGLVLIFNSNLFIKSLQTLCGYPPFNATPILISNMFYEIVVGLLLLGGLVALLGNLTNLSSNVRNKKSGTNPFTVIVAVGIIIVLLFTLFSTGVFRGGATIGAACISSPGFLCTGMAFNNQAPNRLSITLGQDTGTSIYNVELVCAGRSTDKGMPYVLNTSDSFSIISSNGNASHNYNILGTDKSLTLVNGQTIQIHNLTCYYATGTIVGKPNPAPIGTAYCGGIWMNYTTGAGKPGTSNPWVTQRIASIITKVV